MVRPAETESVGFWSAKEQLRLVGLVARSNVLVVGRLCRPFDVETLVAARFSLACHSAVRTSLPAEHFDLAVIDGIQDFTQLKREVEAIYPAMRLQGRIVFHDWDRVQAVTQVWRSVLRRLLDADGITNSMAVAKVG